MFYQFPRINHLDDVRVAIEGYPEFVIAERGHFKVVNYVNMTSDTFRPPVVEEDGTFFYSQMDKLRRECRGLIFDGKTNEIIRRPFHKFFNYAERMETMPQNVDFSTIRYLQYKLDGSMIAPFVTSDNVFRVGTKMGETDIADQAKAFADAKWEERCRYAISQGYTPIFEWMSPWNTVVIRHSEPKLRLIGLRGMVSGNYMPVEVNHYGFEDVVDVYSNTVEDVEKMVADVRGMVNEEGIIAVWSNGHRLKLKGEWYVAIHKVKDRMLYERNVLNLILTDVLDDVVPFLDEIDRKRLDEYQKAVRHWIYDTAEWLFYHIYKAIEKDKLTKKDFALTTVKSLGAFSGVGFRTYDDVVAGKKFYTREDWVEHFVSAVEQTIEKACISNSKLADFKQRTKANEYFKWS